MLSARPRSEVSEDMVESTRYLEPAESTDGFRISRTGLVFLTLTLLALGVLGASLLRVGQGQPTSGPAPDFTLQTFEGDVFRLADQRGKVVIINFWASWCVPCRDEAPILQDVLERYRDRGVVMVGIAYLDVEKDSLAFIEEFGITYPNGLDVGQLIAKQYRIQGVPETFIVDPEGNIIEFHAGPASVGQLDTILERELQVPS